MNHDLDIYPWNSWKRNNHESSWFDCYRRTTKQGAGRIRHNSNNSMKTITNTYISRNVIHFDVGGRIVSFLSFIPFLFNSHVFLFTRFKWIGWRVYLRTRRRRLKLVTHFSSSLRSARHSLFILARSFRASVVFLFFRFLANFRLVLPSLVPSLV